MIIDKLNFPSLSPLRKVGIIYFPKLNLVTKPSPPLEAGVIGSKKQELLVRTFCPKPVCYLPLASISIKKPRQRRVNKGCGLQVLTSKDCKFREPITPASRGKNR